MRRSTLVTAASLVALAHGKTKESGVGSCGANMVPDCLNDMGSCGNACCAVEFETSQSVSEAYSSIAAYLKDGGSDGLFEYVGGSAGLGIDAAPGSVWDSIFQGVHTTFLARYRDTLDFAIRSAPGGKSIVRAFSISNIDGALGDEGQNRRTLTLLGSDVGLGKPTVLFGCGESPSLPVAGPTATQAAAEPIAAAAAASSPWTERALCVLFGAAVALVSVGGFRSARKSALADEDETNYLRVT